MAAVLLQKSKLLPILKPYGTCLPVNFTFCPDMGAAGFPLPALTLHALILSEGFDTSISHVGVRCGDGGGASRPNGRGRETSLDFFSWLDGLSLLTRGVAGCMLRRTPLDRLVFSENGVATTIE